MVRDGSRRPPARTTALPARTTALPARTAAHLSLLAMLTLGCVAPFPAPSTGDGTSTSDSTTAASAASTSPDAESTTTSGADDHDTSTGPLTSTTSAPTTTTMGMGSVGSVDSGPGPAACGEAIPAEPGCSRQCDECSKDGVCVFHCSGASSCIAEELQCPPDRPCAVRCTGPRSCMEAHVECPPEPFACSVECESDESCALTVLTCGGGPCTMFCLSTAAACDEAQFRCGTNDSRVICEAEQLTGVALTPNPDSMCLCEQEEDCG